MPYIPHTDEETQAMLAAIGVAKIEDLFEEIPTSLLCDGLKNIPNGMSEMTLLKKAHLMAAKNQAALCFLGAGSYEHHIPAAVWDIASRGEYLTAYTPYQAEASQGSLQLFFEYQSMIAELTGMDVANASLYDGASALAEAVLMAIRINKESKSNRVLVAGTIHPFYRETLETIVRNQQIELINLPFDLKEGITPFSAVEKYQGEDIAGLVIAQPNFFGCLEQVDTLCDWAFTNKTRTIACVNPISLGLLKPPGKWGEHGVDIVCGEGQPLGVPLAFGGPYFGFFSTRIEHVRQMPGRLIGQTTDKDGKTGYTLTLQAREQHIRRGKATSNICTNQGLLVTAATIYMSLIGPEGLSQIARQCHQNTQALVAALTQIEGVETVFSAPFFHEALIRFHCPAEKVVAELHEAGIAGGYPLQTHYPEFPNSLLICATEMRTSEDIALYAHKLQQILTRRGN